MIKLSSERPCSEYCPAAHVGLSGLSKYMTKVAILGNAGGGKSTLCDCLSRATHLPAYQLDQLLWNPGWVPTPFDQFETEHDDILKRDAWIIDGIATLESIEKRLEASDTIIFVDLPLWVHYWWATKRQVMCIFRDRPNFVEGCPMLPKTLDIIKMMWAIDKNYRPVILQLIKCYEQKKRIFHLQSPGELAQFKSDYCVL